MLPSSPCTLVDGYANLPERFYARLEPTPVAAPHLIVFNSALSGELGLDLPAGEEAALAALFSGNRLPRGSRPVALAYAGHQFGNFVPQLGDGRALLLGETRDAAGAAREVQLKGSGRTPYSRGGDGRAALGPVLREYLVSEAMHALGIPSTRALAAVSTGEAVLREAVLPGAVLTRVAASHVRVGTFEFFAARGDVEAVRLLADWVIQRHYPDCAGAAAPYEALLRAVLERQARLVAAWMQVGFIHGVMNTDNTAVSGETLDFGPCAFMDAYDPRAVFSSIDRNGRYAYANQPAVARWNLARLAEALLPLLAAEPARAVSLAEEALGEFPQRFADHWLEGMRAKLGLTSREAGDAPLAQRWLDVLRDGRADYTVAFRRLADGVVAQATPATVADGFTVTPAFEHWWADWRARGERDPADAVQRAALMRRTNPWLIPRNHRVEEVIVAAVGQGDFAPFHQLRRALEQPFVERPQALGYALPPLPEQRVLATFCGT